MAWQVYVAGIPAAEVDHNTQTVIQYAVAAAIELAFVLVAGRTLGEWVVQLDPVNGPRRWVVDTKRWNDRGL